jgi:hypothetical protein
MFRRRLEVMHSSTVRSASVAVTCILTGALLVGCGVTGSVSGVPSGVSQTGLFRSVDLGKSPLSAGPIGNEMMTSSRGKYHCFKTHGWNNTFDVKGAAQGPYPGKFHASGKFLSAYNQLKSFSESFTITSRSNTITGSFVWGGGNIFALCNLLNKSTDFTYTATLMRGSKVIKQFAGSASESGIHKQNGNKYFGETLI